MREKPFFEEESILMITWYRLKVLKGAEKRMEGIFVLRRMGTETRQVFFLLFSDQEAEKSVAAKRGLSSSCFYESSNSWEIAFSGIYFLKCFLL